MSGPAAKCRVCQHSRLADADGDLRSGVRVGVIAASLGVSVQSVQRHRARGHVAPASGRPAVPATTVASGSSPEAYIRSIIDSLDATDIDAFPVSQRMAVVRERRLAAEALAKVSGASGASESEWEAKYREQREHTQLVARVLIKFPGAMLAVRDAIRAQRETEGGKA